MQDPSSSHATAYPVWQDQMGRTVQIPIQPRRIITLVPSQTELLFDLGLEEEIVGLTKFCTHPRGKKKTKAIVGGTKHFHFDIIDRLQPDLIIGNKEENYQEGIEQLAAKYPVWMSDIRNLPDALWMIGKIGGLTNRVQVADQLVEEITLKFSALATKTPSKVAYLIWKDPYMSVGTGTFIQDMLERCGLQNVFQHLPRYPVITPDNLAEAAPQAILLSSEPYPFQEKHREEIQAICPQAVVKVVDGEMFSWFGSRLRHAPAYFRNLLQELEEEIK
jgi:ABC-type Fe3+-hydroxamate transport system substrate-binding protein